MDQQGCPDSSPANPMTDAPRELIRARYVFCAGRTRDLPDAHSRPPCHASVGKGVHAVKASTLDLGARIVAALLMLVGAVIIFTGSETLAFSMIAVGAAVFVIEQFVDRRRRLAH
jgi:hypothetical protein